MTGANSYLQHVFIPQFWRKNLVVKSRISNNEYMPVPRYTNLDDICITEVYQKIEIRTGKYKRFEACFAGQKLQVTEVTELEKLSSEDNEFQKKLEVLALADRHWKCSRSTPA
ncbi:hypothetical protein [Alteromonas portus]|uniref:hypothetical protein n=1 Tax=Alteromonas portus TaxID=2565549 RepID=UPI003BF8D3E1